MSNYYVSYSDEAKDDLRNIFMHIAYNLGSRDNAECQVNRIREAIKKLDKFPKRNPSVPYEPWASLGMRRLNVDNYVVLYIVDETNERVEIVRIPYGAMDLDKFFENMT
ncbi:ParE toxin of type II toxin-antitoxin system, parDE [Butyrivibrio hungatei]|uniref:ParE toxin of type II toxin-antitoxin system, parDE n=1 Tax=Butyrivibrio hungatei TaxID=185008 RepID=A0A1G5GVA5_9FIRM|nr:type II toxin-antitoxin system RelE/ParE family toxin [Butyrivibrio hungatei]SCY54548.1 ParE toxin of type II toxin-antitoxin system, parDE [Butyrivibrio hungatei]